MNARAVKFSIVIPCYNEAANLPILVQGYDNIIKRSDIEIIIVDNGSSDGSAEYLSDAASSRSYLRVVTVAVNRGYGFGILSGLAAARGEYIGWTHGDTQTPPADIIKAIGIIESSAHPKKTYAKGLRKKRPLFDRVFTLGMSFFETVYLHQRLYDINAQPNLFPRNFLDSWVDAPHDFSLDLYALYMARKIGLDIIRFPVSFQMRAHGKSHWNNGIKSKWKFIKRTLDFSFKLKKSLPVISRTMSDRQIS